MPLAAAVLGSLLLGALVGYLRGWRKGVCATLATVNDHAATQRTCESIPAMLQPWVRRGLDAEARFRAGLSWQRDPTGQLRCDDCGETVSDLVGIPAHRCIAARSL